MKTIIVLFLMLLSIEMLPAQSRGIDGTQPVARKFEIRQMPVAFPSPELAEYALAVDLDSAEGTLRMEVYAAGSVISAQLRNATGELVHFGAEMEVDQSYALELKSLPAGQYHLQVYSDEQMEVQKWKIEISESGVL